MSSLETTTISQTHFTPLAEALHRCVDELNTMQLDATFESVVRQLNVEFPTMELPTEDILKSSLNSLITENKLNYDYHRQTYSVSRTLLTPWDEFENLTLSDHSKADRDEEEIDLEFKDMNMKCANLDQLFYANGKTLSTESSSIADYKESHYSTDGGKLLRRNSSLSSEINKINLEHRNTNFKRSKSFKLNYKPNSDENGQLLDKNCTCNEIIIKRKLIISIKQRKTIY